MGCYINDEGNYYEGDQQAPSHQSVPKRQSFQDTWSGSAWEVSPTKRWEEIKKKRDELKFNGGVKVNGKWFLSTIEARSEYLSLIQLATVQALTDSYVLRQEWRTMDGSTIDMTVGLAKLILAAGFIQVAAIDDRAQALKTNSEDINTGWPAVYTP